MPSPTDFLIAKVKAMDDVTQVLLVTRTQDGGISFDTCGAIYTDALGLIDVVRIGTSDKIRRQLRRNR